MKTYLKPFVSCLEIDLFPAKNQTGAGPIGPINPEFDCVLFGCSIYVYPNPGLNALSLTLSWQDFDRGTSDVNGYTVGIHLVFNNGSSTIDQHLLVTNGDPAPCTISYNAPLSSFVLQCLDIPLHEYSMACPTASGSYISGEIEFIEDPNGTRLTTEGIQCSINIGS